MTTQNIKIKFISVKEFMYYLNCSYPTAMKKYKLYLKLAGKHPEQKLSNIDIFQIDKILI